MMGVVFGSFFTLAVYRIPRKENIVYGRSHCTTCNHKLGFLDLIPVFSYIFLKGRCRYCGEKIRIRYLLLEVFAGLVFLLIALTRGINDLINLTFIYLFVAGMFIIAGIDKENNKITKGLLIYEFCIAIAHLIYIYTIENNILKYVYGLLFLPIIVLIVEYLLKLFYQSKNKKQITINYYDIIYLALIGLMFGQNVQVFSFILLVTVLSLWSLIHKSKNTTFCYPYTIIAIITLLIEPYVSNIINLINL